MTTRRQLKSKGTSRFSKRDRGKKHEKRQARVDALSKALVGEDTCNTFADNCEATWPAWLSLLREATIPNGISSSDPQIIVAFKAVDKVILGKNESYLLRRLAYIQLMRIFSSVEAIIRSERENGSEKRLPGHRDSSAAMRLYASAQDGSSSPSKSTCELKERKRTGRSWLELAGESPPIALMYSKAAELAVKDFKRADRQTMSLLAALIHNACPRRIVEAAAYLTSSIEWAVVTNQALHLPEVAKEIRNYYVTGLPSSS
ncbi:hypothetical protein VHEMI07218 [[Torrubiella] hemipterigena]|uniref:Uncharacterized protein n=1 Tax=[Torrubiella] hemipterigena TaxID=1531966 RepID=A0A0A1TKZ2_9HYPO|nr:hypothetical protein VHEMI07218 [[Torrubiella] hemipterigena]